MMALILKFHSNPRKQNSDIQFGLYVAKIMFLQFPNYSPNRSSNKGNTCEAELSACEKKIDIYNITDFAI